MSESEENKFVVERGLLDLPKAFQSERKKSKEERDIINALKPFARFSNKSQHDRIVNNVLKEYQLRLLVGQLKYFKNQGLTSLDQIENFIDDKKKQLRSEYLKDLATANPTKQNVKGNGQSSKAVSINYPEDIVNSSGYDDLWEKEKEFVVRIGLIPKNYNIIKSFYIDNFERSGEVPISYTNIVANKYSDIWSSQQSLSVYNFLININLIK